MLVTKHEIFKRFWYPVAPIAMIEENPYAFTLLEHKIVVWHDGNKQYAALEDRCCHRSAMLSRGKITNGCLSCPYHGWQYNRQGQVVHIPQLPEKNSFPNHVINHYQTQVAYGYLWVCLDKKPIYPIPNIPEATLFNYRLIQEFYEPWHCAGLRVMENELDLAHPAFVHEDTFGLTEAMLPDSMSIEEFDGGLTVFAALRVCNPHMQQQNLNLYKQTTTRKLIMTWYMPFTCKLSITYPNGLNHIIVNTMTPITDKKSQMVQFCLRNDSEEAVSAECVIAFDRLVTLEDKAILETTDPDVPLENNVEKQLFTDKPGILMRKQFAQLLGSQKKLSLIRNNKTIRCLANEGNN